MYVKTIQIKLINFFCHSLLADRRVIINPSRVFAQRQRCNINGAMRRSLYAAGTNVTQRYTENSTNVLDSLRCKNNSDKLLALPVE